MAAFDSVFWRVLGAWGGLSLLAGCGAAPEERCVLLSSDFEQFEGWVSPLPSFLTTERAHSGRYSYYVGDGAEFVAPYRTTLEGCAFMPSRLRLQAWTYLTSGLIRSTKLVVEIRCHGRRPDIWRGLEVSQVVRRYQKWEHLTKTIHLPADLAPTDEVLVYVWCPERGAAKYFDDITLEGWR
ncbi:hypothetical protein [Hymenobacter sp. IS2118]|uniref:hypothetical protein n=1 Tax=Hymenobacter sp. IS2118 TaxID=1505605 RepID=UPI000555AD75|nr:hypothetical protein [Hymenobacter sp. IS2118]